VVLGPASYPNRPHSRRSIDYRRQPNSLWLDGSISPEADIDTNHHEVLDTIPD
jgi:hypothetical protein